MYLSLIALVLIRVAILVVVVIAADGVTRRGEEREVNSPPGATGGAALFMQPMSVDHAIHLFFNLNYVRLHFGGNLYPGPRPGRSMAKR